MWKKYWQWIIWAIQSLVKRNPDEANIRKYHLIIRFLKDKVARVNDLDLVLYKKKGGKNKAKIFVNVI